MKKSLLYALSGCAVLALAVACGRIPAGQTAAVGAYTVRLSSQPDPLQVGFPAELQVWISDSSGRPQQDCTAGFRQYMPAMDMATDHTVVAMTASGDGVYRGHSDTFSMGGDWMLEITIDCGDGPASHPFPFHLEWPE